MLTGSFHVKFDSVVPLLVSHVFVRHIKDHSLDLMKSQKFFWWIDNIFSGEATLGECLLPIIITKTKPLTDARKQKVSLELDHTDAWSLFVGWGGVKPITMSAACQNLLILRKLLVFWHLPWHGMAIWPALPRLTKFFQLYTDHLTYSWYSQSIYFIFFTCIKVRCEYKKYPLVEVWI